MFRQQVENLAGEKRDLAFVIIAIIEEAVAADPVPGDTLDLAGFDQRKIVRRPAVMAEIVVPGRYEDPLDNHALKLPGAANVEQVFKLLGQSFRKFQTCATFDSR